MYKAMSHKHILNEPIFKQKLSALLFLISSEHNTIMSTQSTIKCFCANEVTYISHDVSEDC